MFYCKDLLIFVNAHNIAIFTVPSTFVADYPRSNHRYDLTHPSCVPREVYYAVIVTLIGALKSVPAV